jgi:hypothetical protein
MMLPGTGQTFSGNLVGGFFILASYVLLIIGTKMLYDASVSMNNPGLRYAAYGAAGVTLGLWAWNIYDAYQEADSP